MKKIIFFILCLFISINIVEAKTITVKFSRCIDGDTAAFIYNNEEITARFLAIDTPETKHPTKGTEPYGEEASNYTCNRIKKANKIKLEYDNNSDMYDKYNRHLVWVFVDNSLLQKELISKGYAKVDYVYGNYKYLSELKTEEENAKNKQIGIWDDNKDMMNSIFFEDGSINYVALSLLIVFIIIAYFTNKKFRNQFNNKLKHQK